MKDIIDTADLPTEMGCKAIYGGWRPRADAAIVSMAKMAGATVVGKTETTAFAFLDPAPTRNPRHAGHTPGGSSSGSAAAVAAGLVPLAVGTQTGGSVIRPAAFCGVAAIKPSFRLLPTVGLKTSAWTLDTLGLFAATVADCAEALAAISGRDVRLPAADAGAPRIALVRQRFAGEASREGEVALEQAARAAGKAGAVIVEVDLPEPFAQAWAIHPTIQNYEIALALAWELRERRADLPPLIRGPAGGGPVRSPPPIMTACAAWRGGRGWRPRSSSPGTASTRSSPTRLRARRRTAPPPASRASTGCSRCWACPA